MTQRRRVPVSSGKLKKGAGPPPAGTLATSTPDAPPVEPCTCPVLDPDEWHDVESDWSDIAFVTSTLNALLGVPVGYARAKAELTGRAQEIGAVVSDDAMLLLGAGRFRRPVMLEVEHPPERARGLTRPGGFVYTRLLPAPWGQMQRVVDETRDKARERYGRDPRDVWLWYLTCRRCSADRDFETLVLAHYTDPS